MPLTTKLPRSIDAFAALPQSDYVEGVALGAASAERIAIPSGAKYVLFSGTDDFCAKIGGSSVTATMPADTSDGSASMLNPTFRMIQSGQTHISVISTLASQITLEFFLSIG